MTDIELLNILNINGNRIGTKRKKHELQHEKKIVSSMQEVSSDVQTQAQKGVALRQIATQAATQTVTVINI